MKIIKKVIIIVFLIALSISLLIIGKGYKMYEEALKETDLASKVKNIEEQKDYTKLEEIPETYKKAVVAVEDHRYYTHNGVDYISIGRAIVNNIINMRIVEGGSSITQQLAKNIYFTQEQTLSRKVAECFMAWHIEKNYNKDKILELYINTCYFGDGYYSLKSAAEGYLKKEPKDMTEDECTLLAGIPNAPSVYALSKNPELARQRQKQVQAAMEKYK